MPNIIQLLKHWVCSLDRAIQIQFSARQLGIKALWPKTDSYESNHTKSDSPYLNAHKHVNETANHKKGIDYKETFEKLVIVLHGLNEFLKHIPKTKIFQVSSNQTRPINEEPNYLKRKQNYDVTKFDSVNQFSLNNQQKLDDSTQNAIENDIFEKTSFTKKVPKSGLLDFTLPEQRLSDNSKANRVPSSRMGRIFSYGELAAGLGLGALSQITRKSLGLADQNESILLSEANANRIVETLCKVRGAALKIGQLLSIQDSETISPQLQSIFERVRQSADFMPEKQLLKVLHNEMGDNWKENFLEFNMIPFAAASIGQVHRAKLHDNTEVAVKLQYPGVADGIESDLKNLMSVLNLWNILPKGLFIEALVNVTRRELAWEVDYEREAKMAQIYADIVGKNCKNDQLKVPKVYHNLSSKRVIVTEMIYGIPVDKLVNMDKIPQEIIDDVGERLISLCLREIFEFRFMQTDPNWSNFFYNPSTNEISLIDFGASRDFSKEFVEKYLKILKSAADKDTEGVLKYSLDIGFLSGYESKLMKDAHVTSVMILGKVFHEDKKYDFGKQDISRKIHEIVPVMIEHRLVPPPEEIYSLHRKISGMFMLMTKLNAKVNCKKIFDKVYSEFYQNSN